MRIREAKRLYLKAAELYFKSNYNQDFSVQEWKSIRDELTSILNEPSDKQASDLIQSWGWDWADDSQKAAIGFVRTVRKVWKKMKSKK